MNFARYRTLRLAQLEREREVLEYTARLERENAVLRDRAEPGNWLIVRLREELQALADKHGEPVPMIFYAGIAADWEPREVGGAAPGREGKESTTPG